MHFIKVTFSDDTYAETTLGQRGKENVAIGIDLNKNFSCTVVVIDRKPKVILNAEGGTITPSVVAYKVEKKF
jgi:molecular chaperone DnaK (HSP70)